MASRTIRGTANSGLRCTLILLALAVAGFCSSGCGKKSSPVATPSPAAPSKTQATDQGSPTSAAQDDASLIVPELLNQQNFIGPLADAYGRIDPNNDGWTSEALGDAVTTQLKKLAKAIEGGNTDLEKVGAANFASPLIVEQGLHEEAYTDGTTSVRRQRAKSSRSSQTKAQGISRLNQVVDTLRKEFSANSHAKFKLYRVETSGSAVETSAYFHADGNSAAGTKEISADLRLTWSPPSNASPPLLQSFDVESCEVVETSGKKLYADVTASVLGSEASYQQQLLRSTDHWRTRLSRDFGLDVVANHGMAIGDVNGDMLEDIYVCQQGGLPNRLFLQQADGTLKDASEGSGTNWLDYCASALIVDLDNDGNKDLVIGHEREIVLMKGLGNGKFTIGHVVSSRAQTFSLAAADYDNDGDIDIYCCGYNNLSALVRTGAMGEPIPYHDAQNGGPNILLRNSGPWNFIEVTKEVGLEQNNNRFSFAASWEDYDNDGDVDLYVANDYGRNNLYRNSNGRFEDVASQLNVEDMSAGMSVSWADYNRDGWMDFYISNMFSAAGNRITYQRQFKEQSSNDLKSQYRRHARGNSLFQANGNGGFDDVSVAAGVTMGRWAWGSKFCDINNDGWQDILVNNGFISTQDTGDL